MDSKEYRRILEKECILDKDTLQSTLVDLKQVGKEEIAMEIERIINENEVEKPALHDNRFSNTNSHYFVNLGTSHIGEIIDLMLSLEANAVGKDGKTTTEAAFYAFKLDKWHSLLHKKEQ